MTRAARGGIVFILALTGCRPPATSSAEVLEEQRQQLDENAREALDNSGPSSVDDYEARAPGPLKVPPPPPPPLPPLPQLSPSCARHAWELVTSNSVGKSQGSSVLQAQRQCSTWVEPQVHQGPISHPPPPAPQPPVSLLPPVLPLPQRRFDSPPAATAAAVRSDPLASLGPS